MIRPGRIALPFVAVALIACGDPDEIPSPMQLNEDSRREVYDRTDLDFEAGVLYKPAEGAADGAAWSLAPLLIQEISPSDAEGADEASGPTIVYFGESSTRIGGHDYTQRSYVWSYPGVEDAQGIRMTIGADGFPAIYEVLHDSSGVRLLFVADALERSASRALGSRLPGRRFAVEPDVEQAPDVVVGGTLESGPTPLGPFVYVRRKDRNVNTVICRCMPSRVVSIPDTAIYDLVPLDPSAAPTKVRQLVAAPAPDVERALRLTSEALRGSSE